MAKILIVEDEPDIREVLEFIIRSAGYETLTAKDGREGLQKALEERPDLIITDVVMPVMGGFELYKKLKEKKITAIIPILVLTARGQMEESFKVVGADDFLTKPFEDYVLLSKVSALLSRPNVLSPPEVPVDGKQKKKILVAGVYEETVEKIVGLLREKGYQVKVALSGPEVITKTVTFVPDLLIMNIQIPGECPSPEIIRVVHMLPRFKNLPILGYSYYRISELGSRSLHEQALNIDTAQIRCMQAGATEYLGRFSEFSFLEAVMKHL